MQKQISQDPAKSFKWLAGLLNLAAEGDTKSMSELIEHFHDDINILAQETHRYTNMPLADATQEIIKEFMESVRRGEIWKTVKR
jgi:hypothetical protein